MALRFFADHCVSKLIVESLEAAGHTVLRLKDYLPLESPDSVVIAKAQQLEAVLLSLDGDFADIVSYPPSRFKGIVSLQIRDHPEITPPLIERLKNYLERNPSTEHLRGKLVVVEVDRIRTRE